MRGGTRNHRPFLWGCRCPGQTCLRWKSAVWMLESCARLLRADFPCSPPGEVSVPSLRGGCLGRALLPCPPLGAGRAGPGGSAPAAPPRAGARAAAAAGREPSHGQREGGRAGPASQQKVRRGAGGLWRRRRVAGCPRCCQPGRDRRPGAAQARLREGQQALGSPAVRRVERQPLATPLNNLGSLLRKVTQWSC